MHKIRFHKVPETKPEQKLILHKEIHGYDLEDLQYITKKLSDVSCELRQKIDDLMEENDKEVQAMKKYYKQPKKKKRKRKARKG